MLQECPSCGYSLKGLPVEHRCPECGLVYDEHSGMWRRKNRKTVVLFAVAVIFGSFYVAGMSGQLVAGVICWASPSFARIASFLVVAITVLVCVVLVRRDFRLWRVGHVVATTPEKLTWCADATGDHSVSWSNITRVAVKPWPLGVVVFLKLEKTVVDIVGPFKNREEVDQFVESASFYIDAADGAVSKSSRLGVR